MHQKKAVQISWLPEPGFGRAAFLALAILLLALKITAVLHFRADSDEPQHAHVVWGWATGQLQYRDLFDNHMPLFQMALAPLFKALGERADILIPLRLAMLPLYFACLWCVYRLAEILFSRQAAPWAALCAGCLPRFFYTSTEFRTDDLWAALWLLSLVVAVSGKFTFKRAFAFGLVLGLAFAVSLKTVILGTALGAAVVIGLGLGVLSGERIAWGRLPVYLAAILAGTAIAPGLTVLYFASKGAFWIMYYCVVAHNIVPGVKGVGRLTLHRWYFPGSIPFLAAFGYLIHRQAKTAGASGLRRVIIVLTPCIYYIFLFSYWPNVTREDDLPYFPLLPLAAIPLVLLFQYIRPSPGRDRVFWSGVLPAVCLLELISVWGMHNLRENRLRVIIDSISDVLKLTKPGDYVMDAKSGYIFRPRAYYWVLEPMTKARMHLGVIRDDIPERLEKTDTKLCYFYSAYAGTRDAAFILANYLPVDPKTIDIGVAGKVIGDAPSGGTFGFDVAIPARYAVFTETGEVAGQLDGRTYSGPVDLSAGHHEFRRTAGAGKAGIILAEAIAKGFHPQLDAFALLTAKLTKGKQPD
jgi:hypothetical protein